MYGKISIIIPVLNDAESLKRSLPAVKAAMAASAFAVEIIVVDGGSQDASVQVAHQHDALVLSSNAGRARQMNVGAARASGDVFLFLHADTLLPVLSQASLSQIAHADWGYFTLRLDEAGWVYSLLALGIAFRANVTSVVTGDQTLFIRRDFFLQQGGFAEIALMEDVELTRRLKQAVKPKKIQQPVVTSARKWKINGPVRTTLLMWKIQLLYKLGVSPDKLKVMYYGN